MADPHAGKIVLGRMTRRRDRVAPALDPARVRVDDRTLPELLDFGVKVAGLVHYYNESNRKDGDFRDFFLNDAAMVLASILAFPLAEREAAFAALQRRVLLATSETRKVDLLREVFHEGLRLVRLIDDWHRGLGALRTSGAAEVVRRAVAQAIEESLSAELGRLTGHGEGAGLRAALHRPIVVDTDGLSPIWHPESVCVDGSIYRGQITSEKVDSALPALGAIFGAFLQAIEGLQTIARRAFDEVLKTGDRAPHAALFIAFARLFSAAQDKLNRFPARLIDLYHNGVLREPPRRPVADSVYLTFTLDDEAGVPSATVPAKTLFSAGADADGADIVFATTKALHVGAARVERLRSLRAVRGPLLDPADSGPPDVLRRVLQTEIAPGEGAPFALFGRPAEGVIGAETTAPATLGLAIASPCLALRGGRRTLRVRLRCAASGELRDRLDRLAVAACVPAGDALKAILERGISARLSTTQGWYSVKSHRVTVASGDADRLELSLEIALPAGAPAIEPGPAAAALSLDEPVLVLDVNQGPIPLDQESGPFATKAHPLSVLSVLEIESCSLEIEVHGLSGLTLSSPSGPLPETGPLILFGAAPGPGALLDVRHPEILVHRPDTVTLRIDWQGLPQDAAGFAGHYRDYNIGVDGSKRQGLFDNRSFRASLRVVSPGPWDTGSGAGELYLFRTETSAEPDAPDPAAKLFPTTVVGPLPTTALTPPEHHDPLTSALRLALIAPAEGFGDSVYAKNAVAGVAGASPDPERCRAACVERSRALRTASRLLGESLDLCGSKADPAESHQCFRSSLGMIKRMILHALLDGLTAGTAEAKDKLGAEALEDLDALREETMAAGSADRKAPLSRWLAAYRAALGADPGSLGYYGGALLDALDCIEECQDKAAGLSFEGYQVTMTTCLVACRAALDLAIAEGERACVEERLRARPEPKVPNAPYLPCAERVTLDYTLTCPVMGPAAQPSAAESPPAVLLHLLPFGGCRRVDTSAGRAAWLPPIETDGEGQLLIGLSGLAPSEPLSLLFHLVPAGGAGGAARTAVVWEALSAEQWSRLPVVSGGEPGAEGLSRTGIFTLKIPDTGLAESPVMPGGLFWIRARVAAGAGDYPPAAGVYPYATLATWQSQGNTGAHLERPRPAGSIESSIDKLPAIKTVSQPIESSGGRPPETPASMAVRLGERLRHKERAITPWDHERLVLDRFPEIERVRVLPARGPRRGASPGELTVVVLPDRAGYKGPDPTTPTVSPDTLARIAQSLASSSSPHVKVHVTNPVYVRITVTAAVEFNEDQDPAACKARLDEDLIEALSPWAEDAPWLLAGQDYPTEDDIAELIRARPYVAAVISVVCDLAADPSEPGPASLDWYMLTSARAHRINELSTTAGRSAAL